MRSLRLAAIAALCAGGPGVAQVRPPATLRLSDAEKAELMDRATEAGVAAARTGADPAPGPGRRIHGTIGAAIGSDGARAAYGAAAIPLGDHAGATISFESSRFGGPR